MRGIRIGMLILALAAGAAAAADEPRRIAITFDDAPRHASHFSGPERARRLNAGLRTAGIQATFFCTTAGFEDPEGRERIAAYLAAGHLIANHAHAHPDLHRVGADAFLADFERAAADLAALPDARKWFRYPYLHEGRTLEERDAVRAGLRAAGYANGYVTVDNYDWHMDRLFQEAIADRRSIDYDRLRTAYVEMLVAGVEFYDGIAREALGQGRVVALAVDRGYAGRKGLWEDEDEIRVEFERRGAWK